MIQLLCCCFNPVQRVSTFQPTGTSVLKLSCRPHMLFNFVDLLLIDKEEAGRLLETRDLGGEREVMDVLQRVVEPRPLVSTILETPEVVLGVLRSLSLIMIRHSV